MPHQARIATYDLFQYFMEATGRDKTSAAILTLSATIASMGEQGIHLLHASEPGDAPVKIDAEVPGPVQVEVKADPSAEAPLKSA